MNIEKFYKNPKKGLTGVKEVHRKMNKEGYKVTIKDVKNKLESLESYSLNKKIIRKGETRKTLTRYPNRQWQADLVFMDVPQGAPASENDGVKYLLTVIDVFSRYAWSRTLKTKKGSEIVEVFKDIFKEAKPELLQVDQGSEFYNKKFQDFLDENDVKLFSTHSDKKAAVVERFNRTLKMRMGKLFDVNQSFRYVDNLSDLVYNYNSSLHRTIKMTPIEAIKEKNILKVYKNVNKTSDISEDKAKFNVGDLVRIPMHRNIFSKEIIGNWTIEIFKIDKVVYTTPTTYKLVDLKDEEIKGSYYEFELNKVPQSVLDDSFRIEKIIEKKGNKSLVKWLGWPEKFASWIDNKDLK